MEKRNSKSLTRREKNLLFLLGIIFILFLLHRFIIDPQRKKVIDLVDKKTKYEEQIIKMDQFLKNKENINGKYQDLNREMNSILGRYSSNLNQWQILYLLEDLLFSEEIYILDISFNSPYEEKIQDLSVTTMDITIPYMGNYRGLREIVENIEHSYNNILISNLIMDRTTDNNIIGDIKLKLYSLDGFTDIDEELLYIDNNIVNGEKDNPFVAFENFANELGTMDENIDEIEGLILDEIIAKIEANSKINIVEEPKDKYYKETLEDFENEDIYFIPSHKNISGMVSNSTNSKYKKHSLRLEYNILAIEEENRVYIDLINKNIKIKYPPKSLGLWTYSYSYSPLTIGLRFKGQAGEKIDVELSKGVNWTGWEYIEGVLPEDLSIYPLVLDKIYLDLAFNRDDHGVLLFDRLEANYPKENNKITEKFDFYIVEQGDTLNEICLKIYGDTTKKNIVMKYNELKSDKDLKKGKILVIPK